jgi:hypothetical protein
MGYCSTYVGNRGLGRAGGFGRAGGCGRGYGRGFGMSRGYGFGAGQTIQAPGSANLTAYKNYLEEELQRIQQELEDNK